MGSIPIVCLPGAHRVTKPDVRYHDTTVEITEDGCYIM